MKEIDLKPILYLLAVILFLFPASSVARDADGRDGILPSKGQTIYVPAYSHIYTGNRQHPFLLTITLSIRNVDPKKFITIDSVNYYDSEGKLVRRYLDETVALGPLQTIRHIVPQKDKAGGSGASFIVKWKSAKPVNPPIIESIMIGAEGSQGISFTSRGRVIRSDI